MRPRYRCCQHVAEEMEAAVLAAVTGAAVSAVVVTAVSAVVVTAVQPSRAPR